MLPLNLSKRMRVAKKERSYSSTCIQARICGLALAIGYLNVPFMIMYMGISKPQAPPYVRFSPLLLKLICFRSICPQLNFRLL